MDPLLDGLEPVAPPLDPVAAALEGLEPVATAVAPPLDLVAGALDGLDSDPLAAVAAAEEEDPLAATDLATDLGRLFEWPQNLIDRNFAIPLSLMTSTMTLGK